MARDDLTPSEDSSWYFGGFDAPSYTMVPDALFDELLHRLSGGEIKVLLYILRRTYGFKKSADDISLHQITRGIVKRDGERLDHGAGVSLSTAQGAIKGLVDKGVIVTLRNRSAEKGDEPTTYALRFRDPLTDFRYPPSPISGRGALPDSGAPRHRFPVPQETVVQETVVQHGVGKKSTTLPPAREATDGLTAEQEEGLALLLAEGVGPGRAVALCLRFPLAVIQQQHSWLDGRRYQDRAACLVSAIEESYGPPVASPPAKAEPDGKGRRTKGRRGLATDDRDPTRYTRGAYGVCPECGCSPHDPGCSIGAEEGITQKQHQQVREGASL